MPIAIKSPILDQQKLATINQKLQAEIDQGKIPGINYLIAHKGQILYRKELGYMDIEAKKPMLPETIFRVYSLTKPVTSVAILQLMEAGLLELDDPVTKFVPELKNLKVWTENGEVDLERPMTIRDLLTHRSGLAALISLMHHFDFYSTQKQPPHFPDRKTDLLLHLESGCM